MTTQPRGAEKLRMLRGDVGVALVVVVALALGLLLFRTVTTRTAIFADPDSSLRIRYPADWVGAQSLQDAALRVEDPQAASAVKTSLTVERRGIDAQSPPTLQTLVDRRVEQRGQLMGYYFLANRDATVGGAKGAELEYAYVVPPGGGPRRASLPTVVRAREYIVLSADNSYYITLAAPEVEWARASRRFDAIIASVEVQ